MKNQNNTNYLLLITFHIIIAILIFLIPMISKIVVPIILFLGFFFIIKTQNRNNQVLILAAYLVGIEVFVRATGGALFYEFAKYGVIFFMLIGMVYSGFSKNAIPYWIYLLLLIPGVILATTVLNNTTEDRKAISFVMSGPVCLGISALYTYQRKVSIETIKNILLAIGLPIISLTTYLILFNPSVRDVVTGTDSNFSTSGGFGPNQVSTVLGLGVFIFVARILIASPNKFQIAINFCIALIMSFRGIVTFSRGGIYTAIIMLMVLYLNLYYFSNLKTRHKLKLFLIIIISTSIAIWTYSTLQTNGLIEKRYNNMDAAGRVKASKLTGREDLINTELNAFYKNPILGVGVAKSNEIRKQETGISSASHNEITRLLAEHGSLGIIMLLILFITPIVLYLDNKQNLFMLPFLLFWLLTINHAAMRIAAPAYIYALSLLKVKFQNKPNI